MPTHPSVLFVIAEDWFFASHFLSLARGMVDRGYRVAVLCRVTDPRLRQTIERQGVRVIETPGFRGRTRLAGQIGQIARVARILRREKPSIVHAISLRMVVIGGLAARLARVPVRVLAMTGLGLLGTASTAKARLSLHAVGWVLRICLGGKRTVYLFENREDPVRLDLDPHDSRVLVVGGAGIDPERETVQPLPDGATLRVALVARMIFTKGIAIAVDAVSEARRAGADVALTLVGAPDPGNPRSLGEEDLRRLAAQPGVAWVGRADDIPAVWRAHHLACVPSLGGEGLPRALLEAAAAGRGIVTTRTPGCATFVRDGVEGLLVPPGDVAALADALIRLAGDRDLVAAMGRAARARVLDGFTTGAVVDAVVDRYDRAIGRARPGGAASALARPES